MFDLDGPDRIQYFLLQIRKNISVLSRLVRDKRPDMIWGAISYIEIIDRFDIETIADFDNRMQALYNILISDVRKSHVKNCFTKQTMSFSLAAL